MSSDGRQDSLFSLDCEIYELELKTFLGSFFCFLIVI